MAFREAINVANASVEAVTELGRIGNLLETLGLVVILWLIFQIIALILNSKRIKEIYIIKEDMKRIERKIDKLAKKK